MVTEAPEALLRFAVYAGENALPLFFVLLAALLVFVTLSWWLARTYVLPQVRSRWPQAGMVLLHGLVGFAIVIGAAVLFAAIAESQRSAQAAL